MSTVTPTNRSERRPFPPARRLIADIGRLSRDKHTVQALLELDVTEARRRIREHRTRTGEGLSFTGFIIACTGASVAEHRDVHAYRDWRGRLVTFDDVDIATTIEVTHDGEVFPLGHVIRAADKKTVREVHDEIRAAQSRPMDAAEVKRLYALTALPGPVRRGLLRAMNRSPNLIKRYRGTVLVTAVGMFGGIGWATPLATHSLGIAVGGIVERPGLVDGRIEPREYLRVTVDFDHDLVDGAPAARFCKRLAELVEGARGL